jgi:hypothetical protein
MMESDGTLSVGMLAGGLPVSEEEHVNLALFVLRQARVPRGMGTLREVAPSDPIVKMGLTTTQIQM